MTEDELKRQIISELPAITDRVFGKKTLKEEFDTLAHAHFEPGDKDYWDAVELAEQYIENIIPAIEKRVREETLMKIRQILTDKAVEGSTDSQEMKGALLYIRTLNQIDSLLVDSRIQSQIKDK